MSAQLKIVPEDGYVCPGCLKPAGCGCGLLPVRKSVLAARAVAANPEKSSRALAKEIGVDEKTVRKIRTADKSAVEKRVGLDGKARAMPKSSGKVVDVDPTEDRDERKEFEEGPIAWTNRATSAAVMAAYAPVETCPRTPKMFQAIEHVISEWTKVKSKRWDLSGHTDLGQQEVDRFNALAAILSDVTTREELNRLGNMITRAKNAIAAAKRRADYATLKTFADAGGKWEG